MIDPYDLTQPWDRQRLEEWIIFGICVCNKPADATAVKVEKFLYGLPSFPPYIQTPFQRIQHLVNQRNARMAVKSTSHGPVYANCSCYERGCT